ncbi:hypothetical protein LIPSTDRAFT_76633 [Lipomyces starkeyi NRRL Y-11557]|uniref:Uncharacterized protein n=1 Tax=Lipomyces starkeyi NRRL Y-11557 TaxID=675824 RepID=A0A1E3PUD1_LIPST|nr:hypothetical protein LIPSTDRAFT_76633 [Lipomyces starkeyi NRRL Y-11557]
MDPPTRPRRNQAVDYLLLNMGFYQPDCIQSFSTGLTEEVHDLESSPIQTASNISQHTRGTSNNLAFGGQRGRRSFGMIS